LARCSIEWFSYFIGVVKMQLDILKYEFSTAKVDGVMMKDLYLELGLDKSQWARWFKKNIEENEFFFEGKDWQAFDTMSNGNKSKDFAISIEMAKHLAMSSKSEKSHEVRQYFIDCEEKLKQQLPTNYIEALQALIESEKAKQLALENQAKAEAEVAKLTTIIDNEFGWSSILRAASYAGVHESTFKWRTLKSVTIGLGLEVKRVPSPRFDYQVLYPIKAFQIAYPDIDFDDLTPETHDDKLELALGVNS